MTYDQYWYDDPLMVRVFRKAEAIRQERADSEAWLQGYYHARAIQSTICNVFIGKGKTPVEYPAAPILTEKRLKREEEKRISEAERIEREKTFARAYMLAFVEAGKNWGKHSAY